jgi:hypothetical protein
MAVDAARDAARTIDVDRGRSAVGFLVIAPFRMWLEAELLDDRVRLEPVAVGVTHRASISKSRA